MSHRVSTRIATVMDTATLNAALHAGFTFLHARGPLSFASAAIRDSWHRNPIDQPVLLPTGWQIHWNETSVFFDLFDETGRHRGEGEHSRDRWNHRDAWFVLFTRYGIALRTHSGPLPFVYAVVDRMTEDTLFRSAPFQNGESECAREQLLQCKAWLNASIPGWNDPASFWDATPKPG